MYIRLQRNGKSMHYIQIMTRNSLSQWSLILSIVCPCYVKMQLSGFWLHVRFSNWWSDATGFIQVTSLTYLFLTVYRKNGGTQQKIISEYGPQFHHCLFRRCLAKSCFCHLDGTVKNQASGSLIPRLHQFFANGKCKFVWGNVFQSLHIEGIKSATFVKSMLISNISNIGDSIYPPNLSNLFMYILHD